jgi:PAS domain S-box-containing protein
VATLDFRWLFLVALTFVASTFSLKIPLVTGKPQTLAISMGDAFIFTSILLFGPEVAVIVAIIEGQTANSKAKIRRLYKWFFNVFQLAVVTFVVGQIFYVLEGKPAPLDPMQVEDPGRLLVEVGICALIYFALNTGSVALAMALVSKRSVLEVWKENFVWSWATYFAGGFLGAIVFLCFKEVRFYFLAIAVPTVLLVHYSYKMHLQRVQLLKEVIERKAAEKALASEKERLTVTLRSIGEGVITLDTEGQIFFVNRVAERLTGWTDSEAVGRSLPEIFHLMDTKTGQSCENVGEKVLQTGEPVLLTGKDNVLVAKDGVERHISHSAAPICDADGKIAGAVLVFHDITNQLRVEEELMRADKMESLGVMAGGIAHDFNNVLSGILLKTQLAERALRKGRDPGRFLTSIEEATQRAAGLNQQLLTFAKGGAPIKRTTSIAALVQESAIFALRGSKVGHDFQIPEQLWPVEVDEGQISQVIGNLAINAEQAMPEGGTLTFRAENVEVHAANPIPDLSDGDYVQVSVEDEGVGMAPEDLPRLFDPYFTTKPKGNGLGLASVFSIVKRHGGHISVQSELDKGSTFTFYLPASADPIEETPVEGNSLNRGSGRLLVMDDEEIILQSTEEFLGDLGYEVDSAKDGAEAIALYQKALKEHTRYAAVIMDLTIPGGMGGKEAIGNLRKIDPEIRAIVSSGYSEDPVMATFREHGFSGVLAKPFKFEELAHLLEEVITSK